MKGFVPVTFIFAALHLTDVLGLEFQRRQTLSAPCTECNNVIDALASCTDKACLCPTASASASACSSCLVASGFGTDAPAIATLIAECNAASTSLVVIPCSAPCSNVAIAAGVCTDAPCLCATLLPSGPSCSSCLSSMGFPADASTIGSYLATNCSALASSTTVTSPTSIPCEPQCSNLVIAADTCGTNSSCLCPTVSASGSACSACLVSAGDTVNAAEIGTVLNECVSGSNNPITAVPCASFCSNIVGAVSTCSNSNCQCSPLLASGSACSSCLSASGFPSDAASLGSYIAMNCSHTSSGTNSSPSNNSSITGTGSVSPGSSSAGTTQTAQSKSGAQGFGVSSGTWHIQFIMFLGFLAGLFCVFV